MNYQHASMFKALIYFFFAKKKYINLAVQDGMAARLEAEDLRKLAQERGVEILSQWEENCHDDSKMMTNTIYYALWSSFAFVISAGILAAAVGWNLGKISITFQVDCIKVLALFGSGLLGWATLFELGSSLNTWDGESLPERTHKIVFKLIFIPGLCFLFLSILL